MKLKAFFATILLISIVGHILAQSADYSYRRPCATLEMTFDASRSTGTISLYEWDFNNDGIYEESTTAQTIVHTFSSSGIYTVTLRVTGGSTHSETIQVYDLPDAIIIHDNPEICEGDSLRLQVSSNSSGIVLWSTGQALVSEIYVKYPQWYRVTVSDSHNCHNEDSVLLDVLPIPTLVVSDNLTVKEGSKVQLGVTGANTYLWSPATGLDDTNSSTPVVYPEESITYFVEGSISNGCSATDSVQLTVTPQLNLKCANIFSPNGDGVNDYWLIEEIANYSSCTLIIYSRWGKEVYHSESYQNDWDGKYNGSELPEGVYYYTLKCSVSGNVFTGDLTLLR